jgi:hypothetical protein
MQLKIQRSQRAAAISGKVIFCLDARVYLTPDEQSNVNKYGLRGQVIYNSEASKKQLDAAAQAHAQGSYFKSLARIALVAMNLNISINSLQKGQHVECKDLDELLSAEEALHEACEKLKSYLETAATFDGREVVIDYSTDTPTVIAPSNPIGIPAPITAAAPPPTIAAPAAPPDLSQPSEHVPLPVQTSAASGAIAFYDGTRDKAAFPNTPDLEAVMVVFTDRAETHLCGFGRFHRARSASLRMGGFLARASLPRRVRRL